VAGCSGRFELGRLDSDGADIPVPPHEHAHRATEGLADHESLQVRHVLDRMNVYLENDVSRGESGACRRSAIANRSALSA
jgi:hypothetical protein